MNKRAEITWSLMHPTTIDSVYMARVVEIAKRYTVDSYELCGAFAHPTGGLNGLLLFEPYPHAAACCNKDGVFKTRETLSKIVELAGDKPVYLWHREIMMPKGMLEDRPAMLDKDGEFDLLGKDFLEFLRYKIDNAFKVVPNLGGIVLTLTEADYSVIHNSDPDRYPPDKVVETIVRLFAEEHKKHNKRFILRSFGSIASDYEDILRGARMAAKDYEFDIETKITPYDFDPFLPPNPFLVMQPGTKLNAECDGLGEFLGAGYLPSANVDNIVRYVHEGVAAGVSRYAIRLDRIGNNIFDCHEINVFAYQELIRNPELTADDIYAMWARDHWRGCEKEMTELSRMGLEAVLKTNFVCGNVVFHKFPILPEWKWVAAGASPGLYHNNVSLRQLRGEWGILADNDAPGRDKIRSEKQQALALAKEGYERVQKLKGVLSEYEYGRAERVWRILNVAVKAIAAFTESLCSYFDDLENNCCCPDKLEFAVAQAEKTINSLLKDTSEALPTMASCCDGAPLPGDDLDRVYLKGLRFLCRELLDQFEAEQKLRRELSTPDTLDLVLPGSMGDQYRCFRYMHASHSELKDGLPIRYAGNTVFPNGFFEVKLAAADGADIEVSVLPGSAETLKLTVNGKCDIYPVPADGMIRFAAPGKNVTLRIEKNGVKYPAIVAIRVLGK